MRLTHYLYIGALALLAACSSEEVPTAEEMHPNGAIDLSAGIVEGGTQLVTRAGAEDHHATPGHLTLTNGTKLAMQISGTWTGHSPENVVKTTTGTIGSETGADNLHNTVTCDPVLYWDDYGTADPANASTGRTAGLTIYATAVNGKTTAPTVSSWTALEWTLTADQTTSGNTPADKDLLISNNVQPAPGASTSNDGAYKFDERASGKLLEFRHALSKITVNLKAGAGFAGSVFDSTTPEEVKLTSNEGATTSWAYTTGTVNVTTGEVSSQGNQAVITMNDAASVTSGYNVTKEALVMPGSAFASDAAIIARINADYNIYYVTAEKIRTAINANHATEGAYSTEAGKNYIVNVTVNKTDIVVTATVTNWIDVTADEVAPVINVSGNLGGSAGTFTSDFAFSFYRSESLNSGYIGTKINGYYPEESVVSYTNSTSEWSMSPTLYWPDHNTHYQFRGVRPQTVTTAGDVTSPRVEDGTGLTAGLQVIKVNNVAYTANSFPSDLQIARPDVENAAANCGNNETGHTKKNLYTEGICAREGQINLTFQYIMSQVEVYLSTTTGYDKVELENAKVELVNVHKTGDVKLGDREVVPTGVASATPAPATDTFGDYILDGYSYDSGTGKAHYHSAIVPQTLTYTTAQAAGNVKFRITITNTNGTPSDTTDDTIDIYYADVEPILETGKSTKVAPNGRWESGYHYIYNLTLSKTEVNVTATLANWTPVTASENVWF